MGGIVTRYMLEPHQNAFRDRTIGLAPIAPPALGSAWADSIRYIAEVIGNRQVDARQDRCLLGLGLAGLISEGRVAGWMLVDNIQQTETIRHRAWLLM
jgi:hypothetical protein